MNASTAVCPSTVPWSTAATHLAPRPCGSTIDRTRALASRTAVLAAVTIGADQVFRLRGIGRQVDAGRDLRKTARDLAALLMPPRSLLQGCGELGVERAVVLPSDLADRVEDGFIDVPNVDCRHVHDVITSISCLNSAHICVTELHQLCVVLRRRRRNREPIEELGGFIAGGLPVALSQRDEELDLETGALDPDEVEDDPFFWDEGADDEVG